MRNTEIGTWATLVKRVREAAGMSGAELARRLDVDRATIWRWEVGRQKPESPDLIKAFATLFGLDIDEVLRIAGLRPSDDEPRPAEAAPIDPDVLKLMRILADPDTDAATKAHVRAMMQTLAELAEKGPKPKGRR